MIKLRKHVRASLLMPTELVAQNGAVIHQTTKIEVSGCAMSKAKRANKTDAQDLAEAQRPRVPWLAAFAVVA